MSETPGKAVFLSYASQDAEAARRIAEALGAGGVEVWFDQSELRGGDAWDQKIRKQIQECTLFLPIISAATQERREGYFRREWKLAADRTNDMAEGVPFIVPVAVGDIPQSLAAVPEPFLRVQWTRLAHGVPTPELVAQVKRLLEAPWRPGAAVTRSGAAGADSGAPGRRLSLRAAGAAAAAALAVAGFFGLRQPATEKAVPKQAGSDARQPATPVADKSIAVLPFTNLSPDKENEFFADGVHEDVLTNLQNIRELRVVSRQSVQGYRGTAKKVPEIARELGVTYILEGSVRRADDTVRVSVQLIDARTDAHLWSPQPYDRKLTGIFAIQSEIAQAIAGALRAELSPQERSLVDRRPTENFVAYDKYLRARDLRDAESGPEIQEMLLRDAVELDPSFAAAWVELAFVHGMIYSDDVDHTVGRADRARSAIDTAVRLNPNAPDTIRGLGDFYYRVVGDYERALAQFDKLTRLQPNNAMAHRSVGEILARQGRWAESVETLRKAAQLDPRNGSIAVRRRVVLEKCRRFDDAMVEWRRKLDSSSETIQGLYTIALIPFRASGSMREVDRFLAQVSTEQREAAAVAEIRKAWELIRGNPAEATRLDRLHPPKIDSRLVSRARAGFQAAVALAVQGDLPSARKRLGELPAELRARLAIDPQNATLLSELGKMEALLGNKEEALRCGCEAVAILPVSRDAWEGPHFAADLAFVYAWTGDKDRAIAEYARLLRGANYFTAGLNVHYLRHGPWAYPLRGDPRFEALLNDPKNNAPLF